MPTVFIIAEDWLLRAGVRAELRERGVEALGMETVDDAARTIAAGQMPSVVVLESSAAAAAHPAMQQLARRIPVVVVASGIAPTEALPLAAAAFYRPLRIGELVARVIELLQGCPA